jgi:2-haloacid dehalogenase
MTNDARRVFETSKPTTLTFDCYGTLIDWENGACRALREIYGFSQCDVTDHDLIALFLQRDARIIRENIFPYSDVLQRVAKSIAEVLGVRSNPALEARFARSLPTWPAFEETNTCPSGSLAVTDWPSSPMSTISHSSKRSDSLLCRLM